MVTLLQTNASLFGESGRSSVLADEFVAEWKQRRPCGRVVVRDPAAEPVPHLSADRFDALAAKPEERSPAQEAVVDFSDALIDELRRADDIVLGLPMYNFGVPSTLKAYFDHVARAGIAFRYTVDGPEGLLQNEQAYVFATRGGKYAGTALDTQTDFVRNFLAFLDIRDSVFVYAEGLAMGEDTQRVALTAAHARIANLAAEHRAAA
ncbi:MAG: FMN-dependent NADH-azoreductase [Gammaproteobacteria bacterium]|nr:FMN-dependent NADH-azoreductase [Gammaproteobacteria bacterium]NIR88839.1 FMN-dependent NADH-azoreductase [Gammaproteobacteria bacterium]NIU06443.1 FMN-dependent NADH-azoreductase [Gammaproteobacteria bacterium]NIV53335.1 FMN-dependent NADH-azoreductase [Gammaproteobacteria bacterium]NIV74054.1 FMN-dependent NADH-azoreductase [Gammaproteobacteria bacterium]